MEIDATQLYPDAEPVIVCESQMSQEIGMTDATDAGFCMVLSYASFLFSMHSCAETTKAIYTRFLKMSDMFVMLWQLCVKK